MRDNTVLAHWQNISLCPYSEVISVHEHGLHSRDTRPGQAVPHFSRLVASTIASDTESWLMIMLMMFFEHLSSLLPLVNRGRGVLVLGSLATLCFTFEQFMQYGRQSNLSWFALTLFSEDLEMLFGGALNSTLAGVLDRRQCVASDPELNEWRRGYPGLETNRPKLYT